MERGTVSFVICINKFDQKKLIGYFYVRYRCKVIFTVTSGKLFDGKKSLLKLLRYDNYLDKELNLSQILVVN
jgi:hypothetical protein